MSIRLSHILIVTGVLLAGTSAVAATPSQQSPRWEQVESVEAEISDEISVAVRDNYVYVTVARPTTVKLFTILGQPISQVSLQPGTSRIKVTARGIYILKIGSVTRRITI